MALVRNLVKKKEEKEEIYASYKNMLFYGSFGKTSTAGALSEVIGKPVLILSPAGGSELLSREYPNVISYPINSVEEANEIYNDIVKDFKFIKNLQAVIATQDKERLEKAKKALGDDFEDLYKCAKEGTYPIGAIVLEEISTISNWIQTNLEVELEKNYIGESKKDMGIDWAKFSRDITDFYHKFLRLPVTTILSTGEVNPTEKQRITCVMPDICQGSASRKIIELVGNVFYFYRTEDLKYKVRLTGNPTVYAKDKLLPIKTTKKLEQELDLTGKPEVLWQYIDSISTEDRKIIKTKESGK